MRTIKIQHQDGRIFYGEMSLPGVFANQSHIGVKLDEKLQLSDPAGSWDSFTFNPKTGALVIGSGSDGESETDMLRILDLPRADEFATLYCSPIPLRIQIHTVR